MSTKARAYAPLALKLLIVLVVAAGFVGLWYFATLPDRADAQQTIVIGQNRFVPGSQAALRVVVQESGSGQPQAGAEVRVGLEPEEGGPPAAIFKGVTDESGSLPLDFEIPAEAAGDYRLVVETESPAGTDHLEQPVTVEREFRLLLTTDKPLYQPGQVIHMRVLALSSFDLTPARQAAVVFVVEDAKGNKVFRQSVETSEFGLAAVDFTLADMVNQGDYKLSVTLGDTVSERTVEVRPYALPKFGVELTTDRDFYLPGQRVEGFIQADYFFGKPVAGGEVRLTGLTYDVERVEAVNLTGQTDETGRYEFSFNLPDYFVGSGLDSQQSRFALEATVIDQTDHPEQTSAILPVAAQPIIIEAMAESGQLRFGVENIIYILTAYPDGQPAQTTLEVRTGTDAPELLTTGQFGLAEFRFIPASGQTELHIRASAENGYTAARTFQFEAEYGADNVLLRADRAAYLVGETMQLTALTPVDSGSVYLDIVKEGQTISTRSQPVEEGRADFAIDLSPDLYGTLELHAYKVLREGTIVRDTRLVVVDAPRDLAISVQADRETYLPGDTANLQLQTTAAEDGQPVPTALGVSIVDESVFALQRQDPGFAKLYFMLEAELMEPFYQVKGFQLPAAYPPDQAEMREVQDASAQAAWADVPAAGLGMQINTREAKMAAVYETQEAGLDRLALVTVLTMSLIPLLLWLAVILALRGSGLIRRSLIGLAKVSGILLLVMAALYGLFAFLNAIPAVEYFFWQYDITELIVLVFGGAAGLVLLGFVVYAWWRNDQTARYLVLLSGAWIGLGVLLFFTMGQVYTVSPPDWAAIPLLISCGLIPGAFLLYGQKLWAEGRRLPGWLPTLIGGVLTLPGLLAPLALVTGMFLMGTDMTMGAAAPMPQMVVEEGLALDMAGETRGVVVEKEAAAGEPAEQQEQAGGEPPRLRQFFPETLYWNPEALTDEQGRAELEIPIADSITTWRLTALASSQDGRLGFATQGMRVFQDFFVDIDLPLSLTQDDRISIPVGVFNYLPEAQQVRLVVEPESWFELEGPAEQTLTIASNEVEVVYFPIRVVDFGRRGFQVTAWGEEMSDAIRREVRVMPNGQEVRLTESDWLRENKEIALDLPPDVVPRTPHVEVKIYTGVMAQVIEGLEKILRLPHG